MSGEQLKELAPHWQESSYYNIYVVTGFDGNFRYDGTVGWAYDPTVPDSFYETVMKVAVLRQNGDSTLAHEFGHSLGLGHTFGNANSNGGECPATTGDCTIDDDGVCDTERGQSFLHTNPLPTLSDINPCTNNPYEGVQYNVMNYAASRKFTPGQRDKALATFLSVRENLTKSLGATPPSGTENNRIPVAASCFPTRMIENAEWQVGPTRVKLGNIDNTSLPFSPGGNPKLYTDYTLQSCSNTSIYTDLEKSAEHTIEISTTGGETQRISFWIDYNNNGIFEESEQIATYGGRGKGTLSHSFKIPDDAVLNTYLRLRVKADYQPSNSFDSCITLDSGEVEDYAVRIVDTKTLSIQENNLANNFVVYPNPVLADLHIKDAKDLVDYAIYDYSGKLVKSGKMMGTSIPVNHLGSGIYVLTSSHKNGNKLSTKFIKK